MRHRKLISIFRRAFSEWQRDDASLLAAALAYYGLFSFVPLMMLALIILNSLFTHGILDGRVVSISQEFLGSQMPDGALELMKTASALAASFSFTIFSLGLLLFGAAGLFVNTKRALSIIWRVPDDPMPLKDTAVSYLRSYLLMAMIAFLLLVTSVFTALILPAAKHIEEMLPVHLGLLRLLTQMLSFLFVTAFFASIYKTLAGVRLSWMGVLPGSALAALLFLAGNLAIEFYVGLVNVGSAFGAAGSLVIFLVWIYYSSQIFLFGAEVVKVQSLPAPPE